MKLSSHIDGQRLNLGQLYPGMAKSMQRFLRLFTGIKIHPGTIVSLADETIPVTNSVSALSLELLLEKLRDVI